MKSVDILVHRTLTDRYVKVQEYTLQATRRDGATQQLTREVVMRGHAACILLYDPSRGTILLTSQFRLPAFLTKHEGSFIEVCAGMLDANDPMTAIVKEAEEECGVSVENPKHLFDLYSSPGVLTEKISYFVAEYSEATRVSAGGGVVAEGEDIEVLEMPLATALDLLSSGAIADAKTAVLLQWAKVNLQDREDQALRKAYLDIVRRLKDTLPPIDEMRDAASIHNASWILKKIEAEINTMPIDRIAWWVGFVQGILAGNGILDVDAELDWTRSLFHAAYQAGGIPMPPTRE